MVFEISRFFFLHVVMSCTTYHIDGQSTRSTQTVTHTNSQYGYPKAKQSMSTPVPCGEKFKYIYWIDGQNAHVQQHFTTICGRQDRFTGHRHAHRRCRYPPRLPLVASGQPTSQRAALLDEGRAKHIGVDRGGDVANLVHPCELQKSVFK